MSTVEGLKEHIEFLKSCICTRRSDRFCDIQKLALARKNNIENYWGKHPDDFIKELEEKIKECEGKIITARFSEGQKTYRVNYQKSRLGRFEMGSKLIKAHSEALAMQMVDGAYSVQEHQEGGLKDLKNQISQIAELL